MTASHPSLPSSSPSSPSSPSSSPAWPLERAIAAPSPAPQHLALGSLRAFLTLLVLLHHALLAYHPFAPPVGPNLAAMPFWRAFPVVDAERWSGATWIVGWNDSFFMALMFLLAGLFVWPSLARKGALAYARDRALRIGLPFAVALLLLAPLAYVPSYLQTGAAWSFAGFWQQWSALGEWPSGPAWFLSLLLAFDLVALLLCSAVASRRGPAAVAAPKAGSWYRLAFFRSPLLLGAALLTVAVAAYVPMALHYGTMRWSNFGPLTFQTSRVLLYAAFFAAGLAIGATGLSRSALGTGGAGSAGSALARHCWLWMVLAAAAAFYASTLATIEMFTTGGTSALWNQLSALTYAAACATISMALLALFLRFASPRATGSTTSAKPSSRLAASLRRNAYGMFLLHYPVVSWLQYAMLDARCSGVAKAAAVFTATVAITWLATVALRRLRPLDRIL